MTIKTGDRLPQAEFNTMTADGQQKLATDVIFNGRKVVLFAVPGAFTPTCSMNHLPGFVAAFDQIKAKGVDTIACTSVNDVHVMNAWAKASVPMARSSCSPMAMPPSPRPWASISTLPWPAWVTARAAIP